MFLLLFSLCKMDGLERRDQEEGAISVKVKAKHRSQPQKERLGHYGSFSGFWESIVQEKNAVLVLLMPSTL